MLIWTKKINSVSIQPEPVDIGLGLREHDVDGGGTNGQGLCHIRRAPAVLINHNLCMWDYLFAEYSVGYFASHDEGWGEVGGASRSLLCRTLDPLLCLRTPADKEKVFRENGTTNIKKYLNFDIWDIIHIFTWQTWRRTGRILARNWTSTLSRQAGSPVCTSLDSPGRRKYRNRATFQGVVSDPPDHLLEVQLLDTVEERSRPEQRMFMYLNFQKYFQKLKPPRLQSTCPLCIFVCQACDKAPIINRDDHSWYEYLSKVGCSFFL